MPRLGTEEGRGAVLPIAPPTEQQEIVRRLEMQLEKLDALQLELEQSREAGQILMKVSLLRCSEKDTTCEVCFEWLKLAGIGGFSA